MSKQNTKDDQEWWVVYFHLNGKLCKTNKFPTEEDAEKWASDSPTDIEFITEFEQC